MFHFNYGIDIIKMYGIRTANISDFFVIATYIRLNLLKKVVINRTKVISAIGDLQFLR